MKHPILDPGQQPSQNPANHWNKYWNWIEQSYYTAAENFNDLKIENLDKSRELNEAKQILDLDILKRRNIVGLTTTAAARLHVTLRGLHAPIGKNFTVKKKVFIRSKKKFFDGSHVRRLLL